MSIGKLTNSKQNDLRDNYYNLLDQHIKEVIYGDVEEYLRINQIPSKLNLTHSHFSDVIQKKTGKHPCYYYDLKIVEQAKILLRDKKNSITKAAQLLTYDLSNFSKFFKKIEGLTPGDYRKSLEN